MKILHVVLFMAVVVFGVAALQNDAHSQDSEVTISDNYIKHVKKCGKRFVERPTHWEKNSEVLRRLHECITEATETEIDAQVAKALAQREATYPYYSFERVYSVNEAGGGNSERAEDDCVKRLVSKVCKRNDTCVKKVYDVCGALADDIQSSQPWVGEDGIYYTKWQFK